MNKDPTKLNQVSDTSWVLTILIYVIRPDKIKTVQIYNILKFLITIKEKYTLLNNY